MGEIGSLKRGQNDYLFLYSINDHRLEARDNVYGVA